MKNNRNLRAFSLIEVSIVVLIIGILIAGITQSSRLLAQAKVNTAKSLTQSSPAASIKGLSLWIESTLDSSFISTETDDGTAITQWRDYNPQVSTKADFTSNNSPTYKLNAINGIPAVLFDGTNDYMTAANFADVTTGQTTVFAVVQLPSTLADQVIVSKRAAGTATDINLQLSTSSTGTGWTYCDGAGSAGVACNYTAVASGSDVVGTNNYILSLVYTQNSALIDADNDTATKESTAGGISFFQNGVALDQAATTGNFIDATTTSMTLGANSLATAAGFFGGYIGEVIIYDRALKTEERQSVEAYLSKKWGIGVTVAAY